jgi:uncharacterized protein (TIGR00297 family)
MNYLHVFASLQTTQPAAKVWEFAAISVAFAALGRVVRGVTTGGAIAGAVVCFALLYATGISGFAALFTVFVLTWASTRVGYARKQKLGTAEAKSGRNALQVVANLGTAAACAVIYAQFPNSWIFAAMAAALAEAAADTVSSEIGQALGGTPRMITTWRTAARGSNGAITVVGTMAGTLAAAVVALVFLGFRDLGRLSFVEVALAGFAGMLADSLFGATVEGHAGLGNNAVNFISTVVSALCGFLLVQ